MSGSFTHEQHLMDLTERNMTHAILRNAFAALVDALDVDEKPAPPADTGEAIRAVLLANPEVYAECRPLVIGDRVPIPTTSFNTQNGGGAGGAGCSRRPWPRCRQWA